MSFFAVIDGKRLPITPKAVAQFQLAGVEVIETRVTMVPASDISGLPATCTITMRWSDGRPTGTIRVTDNEEAGVTYTGDDGEPVALSSLAHTLTPEEREHRRLMRGAVAWAASVGRRKPGQRGRLAFDDLAAFEATDEATQARWVASANA